MIISAQQAKNNVKNTQTLPHVMSDIDSLIKESSVQGMYTCRYCSQYLENDLNKIKVVEILKELGYKVYHGPSNYVDIWWMDN